MVLATAAFRPEDRSPGQSTTLEVAAFIDKTDPPTSPRGYGYFNLWVATLSLAPQRGRGLDVHHDVRDAAVHQHTADRREAVGSPRRDSHVDSAARTDRPAGSGRSPGTCTACSAERRVVFAVFFSNLHGGGIEGARAARRRPRDVAHRRWPDRHPGACSPVAVCCGGDRSRRIGLPTRRRLRRRSGSTFTFHRAEGARVAALLVRRKKKKLNHFYLYYFIFTFWPRATPLPRTPRHRGAGLPVDPGPANQTQRQPDRPHRGRGLLLAPGAKLVVDLPVPRCCIR